MKDAFEAVSDPSPLDDSKSNKFLNRSTSVKISGRTKERSEKSSTRLFCRGEQGKKLSKGVGGAVCLPGEGFP